MIMKASKAFVFSSICFFSSLFLSRVISKAEQAAVPPRGWNSYDSFCWIISEEEFLKNAELVSQRLHPYGYEYVVVDYLWYRRNVEGASTDSQGFDVIDEWGRMIPDPDRWPSSKGGKGFTEVAEKVHDMGLKFGIHVMRGLSMQAFNANTPILDITTGRAYNESGHEWYAKDIGIKERACGWMRHGFMSVNTKVGAGRAFLRSLYQQYAKWGIDFVKHDCVFGDDLDLDEISFVSEVLRKLDRPIIYSLSPGVGVTPTMAGDVNNLVNMYRITGDDWDKWGDVAAHFNIARDFSAAKMIGAKGLGGQSWPDLDMLPLGWITEADSKEGPQRFSNLNLDEQRTQMTLWSMARSPLMFGGDMRRLDDNTFHLITNPTLMEINSFSSNNMEFPYITSAQCQRFGGRALTCHQQDQNDQAVLGAPVFSLTSCKNVKAIGWSTKALDEDLEQVCWKENSGITHQSSLCFYKEKSRFASDECMTNMHQRNGQIHLLATERTELCLAASSNRRLTSKEFRRGTFSLCRQDADQMWELNHNGTLMNSYSGLCALVERIQVASGGIRSWIATGRRGEIYLAFFNLNPEKTVISAKIPDLGKALPDRNLNDTACQCKEVWSGKDLGVIKDSLSMSVERHGCALFVLNCKTF